MVVVPVKLKLLPTPAVQLVPPSVLYSQLAPNSSPVTFTCALLVILSPAMPVSLASATVGAAAVVSNVAVNEAFVLGLPAAST